MRKLFTLLLAVCLCFACFAACGEKEEIDNSVTDYTTIAKKQTTYLPVAVNGIVPDSSGKPTAAVGNDPFVFWGAEVDQWKTLANDQRFFDNYVEAHQYINANTIAIQMPWKVFEPTEGVFNFGQLQKYVDKAKAADLKIVVYFESTNYASGCSVFVPDWVMKEKSTYTRVKVPNQYDENGNMVASGGYKYDADNVFDANGKEDLNNVALCYSNPKLLEKELIAVEKLFEFLEENNDDGSIIAVNIASEVDFTHGWAVGTSNTDDRCVCEHCNAKFREEGFENEGKLEFMTRIFSDYIKALVDKSKETYNMMTYTPVAALTWWDGGRYVEQPQLLYPKINQPNHFVCPSVAPTDNYFRYLAELDHFVGKKPGYESLAGNPAFASGIDTGWTGNPFNNQLHLELAPWYSIFGYGGLGTIYWDNPVETITNESKDYIRDRLRYGFAPLKGAEYYIARYKGDTSVLDWWGYEVGKKEISFGDFTVTVDRNDPEEYMEYDNYGFAMYMDQKEIAVGVTTFESDYPNDIVITSTKSLKGYKAEVGYYDAKGVWVKSADADFTLDGKKITIRPVDYQGDSTKSIYRIYQ